MSVADLPRHQVVAERLIAVVAAMKELDGQRQELLDELETLREVGLVDEKFSWFDFAFSWSAGRASYDYPDEVTQLEAQLKALKETAVETGKATAKPSKPFWTIRPPKS
jgi:hypothetical protein